MDHLPKHRRRRIRHWLITFVALVVGLGYTAIPAAAAAGIRVGTGLTAATAPAVADWSQPGPGFVVNETGDPTADTYMVLHRAPSLAQYRGEVAGLAPTSPEATGAARLDTGSAASQAYLAYLATQHDDLVASIEAEIGRDVEVKFRYDAVLSGIAVTLTPDEALAVSSLPGVRHVERDSERELLTDNGPVWIGADAVWGENPVTGNAACEGNCGEGIVAGIIDTGVNHDHPSFADIGGDGYDHVNPRGVFFGACDPVTGAPFCNDKLIGFYDFTGTGPEDDHGHGSHTASTTAGNVLSATLEAPTITVVREISGVAPHANVISYKGCSGTPVGCLLSALIASINQATLDQVDVINYSIGGSSSNPWADLDAQAFFDAYTAGIFVATSAGNSGPGFGTLGSPADAPWLTSVGASTHDRKLANGLVNMTNANGTAGPADIFGASLTAPLPAARVVYAGDYGSALCGEGASDPSTGDSAINPFPPGTFNGEIVVCDRGTYGRVAKARNVAAGGAGGYVLANDSASGNSLVGDAYPIPGVHISFANGVIVKNWIAANGGLNHQGTAEIRGSNPTADPANGDKMAAFSSRGANPAAPDLVKPDVTAPGVDILAAWMTPAGSVGGDPEFSIISGTSMSSPHTAGAGVLLRATHPDWSPDQVKSALMTTAFTTMPGNGSEVHGVLKEDGSTPADPFDMGAGRVDLHVAANAGLVLDESAAGYEAANPSLGGDASALNIASLGNDFCASTCSWTRTVQSSAAGPVTWTASGAGDNGMTVTVSPASFTLAPGASQVLTITANVEAVVPKGNWTFGEVQLTPSASSVPPAHLPVAVVAQSGPEPTLLHMHGNLHDDCLGDGATDVATGAGICQPHLSTDGTLDTAPPARWGPIRATGPNGTAPQNIHDPNWIWELDAPTTVAGSMTVEWWWGGPAVNTVLFDDFFIRLFADGALVTEQRVRHNVTAPNVPELLRSTVTVPATRAETSFVLQIDPIFVNQNDSFIYYDSQQQCPGVIGAVPCDSRVLMPVLDQPDPPPVAEDDNAFVGRGGTVVIDVLANDVDNGPLAVTIVSGPANGTADVTLDNKISYTHDDSATTSDSLVYRVTDTAGQTDDATVFITIDPGCVRTTTLFSDDFESGVNGWSVDTAVNTTPSQTWMLISDPDAPSGLNLWFTDALAQDGLSDTTKDVRLVSPGITLGSTSTLTFWHRFNTEAAFDGGVLEVSSDGSTWQDIVNAGGMFEKGEYNDTITAGSGFVLSGRDAWAGESDAFPSFAPVEVDLQALAGQTVQFRWRFAQDQLLPAAGGWWVDDVTVTNSVPCQPPVANDDSASVDRGQSVNIDVKANDFDPDDDNADLTVSIESGPAHGNVEVEADGTVTYSHNGNTAASDSFQYRITDPDDQFDVATVSITIIPPPNPEPDAVDDAAQVDAGQSVTIAVKANDSDPNHTNDQLTVSVETSPTHGAAQVTADGQITYTHNGNSATADSFKYRLTDPEGAFDIATVSITIIHDPDEVGDKVTGGGYLLPTDGKKINFGFNAKAKAAGGFQGNLTLNDKSAGVKVKLDTVSSLGAVEGDCGEVPAGSASAEFSGTGTYNGGAASFRVCVADLGEPGNSGSGGADLFYLECTAGCSYSTGDRTADDTIDGGNIQVHRSGGDGGTSSATSQEAAAADGPDTNGSTGSSASVLILDPMLLTESSAVVEVLTVTAYDAAGDPMSGVTVSLDSVGADGVVTTLNAATDAAGLAVFTVTVGTGDVEHIARSGLLTSNAIDITGLL